MFLFGKKKKEAAGEPRLYAPLTGECMPIDKVPDPVFADKILGDGVAVLPTDGAGWSGGMGGVRCLVRRDLMPTGWDLEKPTVEDVILFLVKGAKEQ